MARATASDQNELGKEYLIGALAQSPMSSNAFAVAETREMESLAESMPTQVM
jgi:hypothetical protein